MQPPDETSIGGELRPSGPVRLRLTERRLGDATVICVAGELDVLTAPRFASLITEIIRTRPVDVLVDLRETDFIDSAGLHILLNAQRRLRQRSSRLAVICASGPVRRVLELSRLIDTLCVVASIEEAAG